MNQLTANSVKIYKINSIASSVSYLKLSHKRINSGVKDIPDPPPIIEQNVPLFHISYSNTVNLSCMLFSRGINTKHTKRISYSFCVFCVYLSVFCMTVLVCNHICIVRLSQVFKIKVELKVEVESFAFCVTVRDRKTLGSFEFRSKHGGLSPEHAWEHRPRAQDGFSYLETSIRDCPNDVIRVWLS